MAPLLQQFSLENDNWWFRNFGVFPGKDNSKLLTQFKSDVDNYWFITEEFQDNQTNKVFLVSEIDAEIALKNKVTVTKISKTPFSVKLNFEELRLSDGDTLNLSVGIRVRITDPVRFYCRYKSQFSDYDAIQEGDNLHSLWETPFQNVMQVEAHKADYPSWATSLAGPVIASAIKTMYFAPMAAKYVDGTELELVEYVDGYSPSVEKRSEEEQKALEEQRAAHEAEIAAQEAEKAELKRKQAELAEKEKAAVLHSQNMETLKAQQAILQEERAKLQDQINLKNKDIEIKNKEIEFRNKEIEAKNKEIEIMREKRLLIEQENRIRKEKEEEQLKKQLEARNKIINANSKKWPTLSEDEILIAHNFSTKIKKRLETNGFPVDNAAVVARSVTFKGSVGHYNTLAFDSSLGFTFNAPKSGYVTILNLGTSGKMTVLIPNALTGSDTDLVKAEQGVQYYFPQSFMPDLNGGSFTENSKSGLEGIYVFITQQPFLNCPKTGNLKNLDILPYSQVQYVMEMLDEIPEDSWSVGSLEFLVVDKE